MASCTDLATKSEVAALRVEIAALKTNLDSKYIPQTEKAGIINSAVSLSEAAIQAVATVLGAKIITASAVATEAKTVAGVAASGVYGLKTQVGQAVSASGAANSAALNAAQLAKKANYEALYASSRASSAASAAASARGIGIKALGLVGSVFGIIGTLATAAALAALAQQVAEALRIARTAKVLAVQNENELKNQQAKIQRLYELQIDQGRIQREQGRAIKNIKELIGKLIEQNIYINKEIDLQNERIAAQKIQYDKSLERVTKTANEALRKAEEALNKLPPPNPPPDLSGVYTEINALKFENGWLQSDANSLRAMLNSALAKVDQKEDKYIVRRVEKQTITNASSIRDINGNLVGLPSKFGQQLEGVSQTLRQEYRQGDLDTRNNIANITGLNKPQVEQIVDTKLQDVTKMNEQQASQINSKLDNLNNKVPGLLTPMNIALAVGALDIFRQILNKPSGGGGSCFAPQLVPPVAAQTKANFTAIGTLQGVTIAQGGLIQNNVTAVAASTTVIQRTVTNTTYGLQAAHRFAQKAWTATHADKILSLANTALNIHNAIMLSNNIGRSMAYIADNVLATFGVKDATTGDEINVGAFVRNKLNSVINQVLGVTQADALRRQLAAYNRIYQTGANVLYNVRSIIDSTQDIAETTGENVAVIGNALKAAGAVRENAFGYMPEKLNNTNRVINKLEKISNATSVLEDITSDTVDLKDELKELKDNQKEFTDAKDKLSTELNKENAIAKSVITKAPEQTEADEIRAIPKDNNK